MGTITAHYRNSAARQGVLSTATGLTGNMRHVIMSQADSGNITILSRRAALAGISLSTARRPIAPPVPDLNAFPDEYALRVTGTCMEPLLLEKATAVFSKSAKWKVEDIVAVWFRPEVLGPGGLQTIVKKLTMAPPFYVRAFPFKDHPESDVAAVICVELLNPRRRLIARCADILAIHKLVSVVNAAEEITSAASGNA